MSGAQEKYRGSTPVRAADGGDSSGLVYSRTSDTHSVCKFESRVKLTRKNVINSARLISEDLARSGFRYKAAMITPTYAPWAEWEPKQITDLLKTIRQYLARRGHKFRYVWVMELTKKGKPHYHLILWLPKGLTLPKPDKQGWWKHGMTKIEWAKNSVGYIAKYASKCSSEHSFPRGARLCGSGGLTPESRIEKRFWTMPKYVRDCVEQIQDIKRIPGGFLINDSGEFIPSRYEFVGMEYNNIIFKLKESEL